MDNASFAAAMAEAGLPEPLVKFLVDIQDSIRQGALDVQSAHLPELLGRPVTALSDVIESITKGVGSSHN